MNVDQPLLLEQESRGKAATFPAWIRKNRWFFLFVVVPTVLAAIYYLLIASDIYVSESRFVIKSPDEKRPQLSTLANLIQTTGLSTGQEQSNEVLEFIRSRNALTKLDRTISLRARYGADNADFISRFPAPLSDSSFENLYKYYTKMVTADLDPETSTAIVTVKAFTPSDAYRINQTLLTLSEGMVNRLNVRAENRAVSEAQREVNLAVERARTARVALSQYRNQSQLIDPSKQAVGILEISNGLTAQRAALTAQLQMMERETPQNPSITALRNRIAAISGQIAAQEGRVVGGSGNISSKLGGYENLTVEQEFATENLNVANAALVRARSDAQRQKFYLERVVDPNMPDMPLLPRRLFSILVVAAAATCLYFIGWMLIVGILEHAPEE
jgi:capsular polysaccharide transport system permease protein